MASVVEGTVISGTHRDADLIPAFTAALEGVAPGDARQIRQSHKLEYAALESIGEIQPEIYGQFLVEALMGALDESAPEGMYFGAHPGDGSDFGFWTAE